MSDKKDKAGLMANLQNAIGDKLMDLFDMVITERKSYYEANPDAKISVAQVQKMISQYGNTNAAISGGLSLVPGLAGLATAVPEIALVVRNQLQLIYDIGAAHQKDKTITKELLAGILLSYFGSKGLEMLAVEGTKVLLKETSIQFFEQVVSMLSINISQQLIQSALVKWVPIAGTIAMAMWSRYSTMKIGNYAHSIFSKDIQQTKEKAVVSKTPQELEVQLQHDLMLAKIKVLINMMRLDLSNDPREIKFVEQIIQNAPLQLDEQLELAKKLHDKDSLDVDMSIFKQSNIATTGLLIDMLALAKSDEETQLAEMLFLKKIAQSIGISEKELEELLK